MWISQQKSDHSKSIYDFVLVDDRAYQNIGVSHGLPHESIRADFELFSQYDLERFLPNERYSMIPSDAGVVAVKYLEGLVRNVRHKGTPLPIPKEEIPCIGGLVFVSIRDLSYSDAKSEIKAYIEKVGNRRVYISELAEELQIDMDLIEKILNDIRRSSGIDNYV